MGERWMTSELRNDVKQVSAVVDGESGRGVSSQTVAASRGGTRKPAIGGEKNRCRVVIVSSGVGVQQGQSARPKANRSHCEHPQWPVTAAECRAGPQALQRHTHVAATTNQRHPRPPLSEAIVRLKSTRRPPFTKDRINARTLYGPRVQPRAWDTGAATAAPAPAASEGVVLVTTADPFLPLVRVCACERCLSCVAAFTSCFHCRISCFVPPTASTSTSISLTLPNPPVAAASAASAAASATSTPAPFATASPLAFAAAALLFAVAAATAPTPFFPLTLTSLTFSPASHSPSAAWNAATHVTGVRLSWRMKSPERRPRW